MKERPILFNAAMVRAILSGQKTQTRRVAKFKHWYTMQERDDGTLWPWMFDDDNECDCWAECPQGQPGDRLWAREAWRVRGGREYEYQKEPDQVMYRATHEEDGFPLTWDSYKWRPSIHMPRWACRLVLDVVSVRIERLQDIRDADAMAEGVSFDPLLQTSPREAFMHLWMSINGPESWAANPWVWVIEFRRAA